MARLDQFETLVGILQWRAAAHPLKPAFIHLGDGEKETARISYGELDRAARSIAARLSRLGEPGDRVLLCLPHGPRFIEAFLGCLYGGFVAVPAAWPHPAFLKRALPRLRTLAQNARPSIALSTEAELAQAKGFSSQMPAGVAWLAVDGKIAGRERLREFNAAGPAGDRLALLQYTSGSTTAPKGVMITHANLIHNLRMNAAAFEIVGRHDSFVTWLPIHHDMGLIGTILQPLHLGTSSVLLSPLAFIQRPARWLRAISNYKATISGAPNFAYDLCVEKISKDEARGFDLSRWRVAFNGSERVRAETLQRFARTFKSAGFRAEAFLPCYGLAEATAIVSGGPSRRPPKTMSVGQRALSRGRVEKGRGAGCLRLVSSGRCLASVEIADPETLAPCPAGRVGEIWAAGPHVAGGYWDQAEESAEVFRARLADGKGPFLRTGDLGFVEDGELFVVGRIKDKIVIRGQNHYPDDLERTAVKSSAALAQCAAFSVDQARDEKLVLAAELRRGLRARTGSQLRKIKGGIAREIALHHGLSVKDIALLRPGALPKTTSGKVQRHACRIAFLAGKLDLIRTPP